MNKLYMIWMNFHTHNLEEKTKQKGMYFHLCKFQKQAKRIDDIRSQNIIYLQKDLQRGGEWL